MICSCCRHSYDLTKNKIQEILKYDKNRVKYDKMIDIIVLLL